MDVDAKKQAATIYEAICATSADRPFSFHTAAQRHREIVAWQSNNPGLTSLRQAPPDVLIAFLSQSVEWLRAESRDHSNFSSLNPHRRSPACTCSGSQAPPTGIGP